MPSTRDQQVITWRISALAFLASVAMACAPAMAQLPDLIDNTITRKVEDSVVGQIAKKVEDAVEQTVSRTVDIAVDNSVTRSVDGAIDGAINRLSNAPVVGPVLDRLGIDPDKIVGLLPPPKLPLRDVPVEDNWRAVDHEWVALIPPAQLAALQTANVRVMEITPLEASGLVMVRVVVSDQDNAAGRAQALLRSLGATAADRNHIYGAQEGRSVEDLAPEEPSPAPAPQPASGAGKPVVGLIDTALNRNHPALKSASIVAKDFVASKAARPTSHGTGIASLLVGDEKGHEGLLPRAKLVAASVFYQGDGGATGATTSSLVASLDWMAAQKVAIVNMSLAGPPNEVLGVMIGVMAKRGMLVVAAVGNDGPASRPLYPAAFEPVVAVTAVDRKSQIYRWANQGPQVDVAAWGVGASVARDKGGYGEESGTSFAAPIVAAALAQAVAEGNSAPAALRRVIANAEDLGAKGRDNVYGYGLVKPAAAR